MLIPHSPFSLLADCVVMSVDAMVDVGIHATQQPRVDDDVKREKKSIQKYSPGLV